MRDYRTIKLWKDVDENDWMNWKWQINNSVTTVGELEQVINLSNKQKRDVLNASKYLKMKISPHIISLIDDEKHNDSLKKQFIPSGKEVESADHKRLFGDVNADDRFCPVDGLVHRYKSKVLLFPTNSCGSYCRYCFRRKLERDIEIPLGREKYKKIFDYISKNREINEVILSGGDPLVLDDDDLEFILKGLKKISNVELIRIHTRMPVTIPYRVSSKLVSMLAKYKPIYMVVHIDTAREISEPMREGIIKLVDNGIPCLASCPLLKGINDDEKILEDLWMELVKMRIKPYYLFQSDPVQGLLHFLVPLSRGIKIMRNLYNKISGLAVPHYCFNVPDGGGHVLVDMNCIKELKKGKYKITNFEGKKFIYDDVAV